MSTKTNAPMVLFFCTNRLAESTELKKNTPKRYTTNAMMLSNIGEKSNIDIIILYQGVVCSPGMNADFVMNAGIHNTRAIKTTATCCEI